jgi:hypothetical protein
MTRLRTYAPIARVSAKTRHLAPEFRIVYELVDARSEGRCEVNIVGPWAPSARCTHRAADHHHVVKPRRSHHDPALIVAMCRIHHDRCEWPYQRGRLVVTPLGDGRFTFALRYAADKFSARLVK